jgi:hypothetical protein
VQISHRKTPNDHTSAFIHFSLVACIARQKRYKQRPRHVRACACAVVRVRVRVLYLWRRAGGVHGHHLGRHPLWQTMIRIKAVESCAGHEDVPACGR